MKDLTVGDHVLLWDDAHAVVIEPPKHGHVKVRVTGLDLHMTVDLCEVTPLEKD